MIDDQQEVEDVVLTKIKLGLRECLSETFKSSVSLRVYTDFLSMSLLAGLEAEVFGRLVTTVHRSEDVPATWWDHFLRDALPWWLSRAVWWVMRRRASIHDMLEWFDSSHKYGDPTRYVVVNTIISEYHMCPHLELGPVTADSVHLKFLRNPRSYLDIEWVCTPPHPSDPGHDFVLPPNTPVRDERGWHEVVLSGRTR